MRAISSRPPARANGVSASSTSYGAATSKRTTVVMSLLSLPSASAAEGGQDFCSEAVELLELVVADEPHAQVGDPGLRVAAQGLDDGAGRTEPHRPALVHATPVVGGEELRGQPLGRGGVAVEADGGVDAQREV